MLARAGYTVLGAATLARHAFRQSGWKARSALLLLLLYCASWMGLHLQYGLVLRWGAHHIRLGADALPQLGHGGQVHMTQSGDFLWVPSSP
jgi:hypothetical protein